MANDIMRVVINWTGFVGGPGFTNLYFTAGGTVDQAAIDEAVTKTDTWLNSWGGYLPGPVTVGVDPNVAILDSTTGTMTAFGSGTPEAPAAGQGIGNYSGVSGACINWYTDGIRNGRRVRGRSFMVPLANVAMSANGTLDDGAIGTWRTATEAFIAGDFSSGAHLGVWSRPTVAAPASGVFYPVSSFTIPDKAAILTSRRD